MSKCTECSLSISVTDKLTCHDCTKSFHGICTGMVKEEYKKLSVRARKGWRCGDCISAQEGTMSPEPTKVIDSDSSNLSSSQIAAIDDRVAWKLLC